MKVAKSLFSRDRQTFLHRGMSKMQARVFVLEFPFFAIQLALHPKLMDAQKPGRLRTPCPVFCLAFKVVVYL